MNQFAQPPYPAPAPQQPTQVVQQPVQPQPALAPAPAPVAQPQPQPQPQPQFQPQPVQPAPAPVPVPVVQPQPQFQPQPQPQFQPQPQPQPQFQPQPQPQVQTQVVMQPVQPVQPAMQPGVLPQYHLPDETVVQQAYEQSRQEALRWQSFGTDQGGPKYLKFLGPQGQTDWSKGVPIGYEAQVAIYIAPAPAPGQNIFKKVASHFWKSMTAPMGTSIGCPGPQQCLICQGKDLGASNPDPGVQKRSKEFGKTRKQYLYNVFMLENLAGHYDEKTGEMRPFILGAGVKLHNALGTIIEARKGAMNIVDPMRGRPIILKRTKTGPNQMDVAYEAIDMDPSPLPPQFYPALNNLWNLEEMERVPAHEDMVKAVTDMGIPMAQGLVGPPQQQAAQPWNAQPQAPAPSPYPTQPQYVAQPQQPTLQPIGAQAAPVYVPPPADPYEFPLKDAAPAPGVSPFGTQVALQPAPTAPPPLSPPPVQSTGQETLYVAQPSQLAPAPAPVLTAPPAVPALAPGAVPAPPPVTAPMPAPASAPALVAPQPQPQPQPVREPVQPQPAVNPAMAPQPQPQPQSQPQPQQPPLTLPLAPGVALQGGRERCFGKYDAGQYCVECPAWIKAQCQPLSGFVAPVQPQPQPQQPQNLADLHSQLSGKV